MAEGCGRKKRGVEALRHFLHQEISLVPQNDSPPALALLDPLAQRLDELGLSWVRNIPG